MKESLYPYEPHQYGVPFSVIEQRDVRFQSGRLIRGGSGRVLEYGMDPSVVFIRDAQKKEFHLWVSRKEETRLAYDLRSRPLAMLPEYQSFIDTTGHHKDLFAKHFVIYTVDYFERIAGKKMRTINTDWSQGGINYQLYKKALQKTGDPTEAARSTWSGELFSSLGFRNVCDVQEKINQMTHLPYVTATFSIDQG